MKRHSAVLFLMLLGIVACGERDPQAALGSSGPQRVRPAFHVADSAPVGDTPYVIDPSRLYYDGNSQGAIEGGALVATSPDVTRGARPRSRPAPDCR